MELQSLGEWNSGVCGSNWANASLCFSSATNFQTGLKNALWRQKFCLVSRMSSYFFPDINRLVAGARLSSTLLLFGIKIHLTWTGALGWLTESSSAKKLLSPGKYLIQGLIHSWWIMFIKLSALHVSNEHIFHPSQSFYYAFLLLLQALAQDVKWQISLDKRSFKSDTLTMQHIFKCSKRILHVRAGILLL